MNNNHELQSALSAILHRMDVIALQCGDDFPLYALQNQHWQISKGGSWLGGFWAGCWWLRAKITGNTADLAQAQAICARLADKIHSDSINRSFIFYYGAALAANWFDDSAARQLLEQARVAFAASYDETLHCIPVGTDMGGGKNGGQRISIDSLAAVIELLVDDYETIARRHTDTLIAACFDSSGAWHSEAHYENGQFQTSDVAGDWSRGQAWGMLGLSVAAMRWGEPYLSHAQAASHYWQQSRLAVPPLNRLSQTDGLYDASAVVIAALAMRNIAENKQAQQQLMAVLHSAYFNDAGVFCGCCYATGKDKLDVVESMWGYFLLLTALSALSP